MTRKDFLGKISLGAAFVLTVPCLHSCSKDDDNPVTPTPPTGLNITIDLNDARANRLQTNGGFIVRDQIVVARTNDGGYAAASLVCSHEANLAVVYEGADQEWFCGVHGARFDVATGAPLNTVTNRNLTIYNTELSDDGNSLRVFA